MDGFYQRVTQAAAHHAHVHAHVHADAHAEAEAGQNGGGLLIIGHAVVMRTLAIWALNAPLSAGFVNRNTPACSACVGKAIARSSSA